MRMRCDNCRNLVSPSGMVRLRLRIRRCETPDCPRFRLPSRPEAEGALALPQHAFGLDVIALVGVLCHREHRSVPEIHALLRGRGLEIAERSVTNLLDRYDELLATGLTGVQHQLCQFHFLREAGHPVFEADRHAKVALKAQVRGGRPIERSLEGRGDTASEVARGYCAAVRSAITDDGRPPLAASGLKLKARLEAVADSLDRVTEKGGPRRRWRGSVR